MKTRKLILNTVIALSVSLLLGTSAANAASKCKGQAENVCAKDNACSWIAAHKRKDGAKVKAYCRTKPKKSAIAAAKKPSKKVNAKKTTEKLSTKKADTKKVNVKKATSKTTPTTKTKAVSTTKAKSKKVVEKKDKKKSS